MSILDNKTAINKLDSKNMLRSIELLPEQITEIAEQIQNINIPSDYAATKNIIFLGMGGAVLGAHVVKTVFSAKLTVPLEILNHYEPPAYVNEDTLAIISSYSGSTEEALSACQAAHQRHAKVLLITSGGALGELGQKLNLPTFIFHPTKNPCGSPRMGLGYTLFGALLLLVKTQKIILANDELEQAIKTLSTYQKQFSPDVSADSNTAKKLAESMLGRSVWYVGAEHLGGSMHVAANQMNENTKRFAGFFLLPELNHHLMEGMLFPKDNSQTLFFMLVESALYYPRVQERFKITKQILEKNNISYGVYQCQEKTALLQACELLVLGSYVSFYGAMLQGIDPTDIPFVDYFKAALKK